MNRDNHTPPTHARLQQLQLAQADAQYLKQSAIDGALSNDGVHRRRLSRGVGGDQQRLVARRLRRNPTPAERALWTLIRRRRLGTKFRRKPFVQGLIVDFFAPSLRLIVEIGGPSQGALDARLRAQRAPDSPRDAWPRRLGYEVARFTGTAILHAQGDVVRELRTIIARRRAELAR